MKSKNLSLFIFFIFTINFLLILNVFPQVAKEWVRRYDGPGYVFDRAKAIAVDSSGNVYVTGESYGGYETEDDYATIKYNSAGVQQWVVRYNGPVNGYDFANAIVVDTSGNVYITGESVGSGQMNYDYATIKYNSSGVQKWVARYNGPGNGIDGAYAIALDSSGNVYVTGGSVGSGTNWDYATIKYNSAGVEQWVKRYNGPGNEHDSAKAIAIDTSGNVYVTGESDYDYETIKYNSSGVQQWAARYNSPGNYWDSAVAIALDSSGNVYVTGWSYGPGTDSDYATTKYNSAGIQQWVARYNGPGNYYDSAVAIAVDTSGNVYVTGYSYSGAGINDDYATIKYNSIGIQQWVTRYNCPVNLVDRANAIALDSSGNIYVTGYSDDGSGSYYYNYDYVTIKYNNSGVQQWLARYNGPSGSGGDKANAIAIDKSGNVYVTGESNYDYATIKYSQGTSGIDSIWALY